MMKKKCISLFFCFLITISIFTGCAQKSSLSSETSTPVKNVDEPQIIEITAVRPIPDNLSFSGNDDLKNNVWTRLYESKLGIKINYEWMAPVAQYDQKLNISISSDSLPDIFQVNAVQLKQLVEDEQVADLTNVFEQYTAPYTKDVLNQDGGNALLSATFDGKLLAIPKMGSGLGNTNVLWVRTDWLKALNLSEPKTIDDLVAIAKAFTENDPNHNNEKDTYGFALNKDLWGMFASLEGFFNGFGAYPNIWVKDNKGELENGNIQPEIKQALQKLQEMFKAGYIDPEFGVKDSFKVSTDVAKGKIGMFYGLFWNMGWLAEAKTANPDMEWKAYPIVGVSEGNALAQVPFPVNTYYVVNRNAEHPEAIVQMLNLQLEKCFGETAEPSIYNVDADSNPIFEYPLIYSEPPMKNPDAQIKVSSALESGDTSKLNVEEKGYYDNIIAYRNGDMAGWSAEMNYGPESSLAIINGYAKSNKIYNDNYFGPPTNSMTQNGATLSQLQLTVFTDIIMGGDINQFDKYVSDWKSLGGDAITTEVNQWLQER